MCVLISVAHGIGFEETHGRLRAVLHESAGVDCCGCIVVTVTGNDVELTCNECGAVVGVVQVGILRDLVSLIPGCSPKE